MSEQREPDVRCQWLQQWFVEPPNARPCEAPAVALVSFGGATHWHRYVCDRHHLETRDRQQGFLPLVRDPLPVALFLGALAGWLDDTLARLLSAHVAGDEAAARVALDLAEVRSLDDGGWEPVHEA